MGGFWLFSVRVYGLITLLSMCFDCVWTEWGVISVRVPLLYRLVLCGFIVIYGVFSAFFYFCMYEVGLRTLLLFSLKEKVAFSMYIN